MWNLTVASALCLSAGLALATPKQAKPSLPVGRILSNTTSVSLDSASAFPYDPSFDIKAVASLATSLPTHSWEFGTAAEALLELYTPQLSVFGNSTFTTDYSSNVDEIPALTYAKEHITIGTDGRGLADGNGATGDPASLGVSAVMLGKKEGNEKYTTAAVEDLNYLVLGAPRFWNGAISQRADVPELWADFVYMAPPFLAYYAVDSQNLTLLDLTVTQLTLYRQVLHANLSSSASYNGLWEHISGPQNTDSGLWSTGNGWAAAGMTRVLATILKAPPSFNTSAFVNWKPKAITTLTSQIMEIVNGAVSSSLDNNGLVRNYISDSNNSDEHGFGEISGSSLLASVVYRLAVLIQAQNGTITSRHISWADSIRQTLGTKSHLTSNGTAVPAVNPLNWLDTTPYTAGSPEGQNFVVLMYTAWRDCVQAGVCQQSG